METSALVCAHTPAATLSASPTTAHEQEVKLCRCLKTVPSVDLGPSRPFYKGWDAFHQQILNKKECTGMLLIINLGKFKITGDIYEQYRAATEQ